MTNLEKQLFQLSAEDFWIKLEEKVTQVVAKLSSNVKKDKEDKSFYTRQETADLLNVSLATLHNWAKQEILLPTKVGSRVYYSSAEVNSKLQIVS